jgi:3-dehydroquinate synthase
MIKIRVTSDIDYEVMVGDDWRVFVNEIFHAHTKVLIIAPQYITASADLTSLQAPGSRFLFISPDGERQKDFDTVETVWNLLGSYEFGRNDAIIGIGGGATTDLAGFVAATWLRGIHWYAVPTTLAGMVDASVGGKTGINTSFGKNLVGSFYSPQAVCADSIWLRSLSDRDFSAGLAEVIKTGFIRDLSILDLLEECEDIQAARESVEKLIAMSIAVKADVVSNDFKEGKLREILNFGHTFGHAVEKSSNFSLRHGEAVSLGLHYEALLSESLLGLAPEVTARLRDLLEKFNLPLHLREGEYAWSQILSLMASDKKSRDGRIRFVGLSAAGQPGWIEEANSDLLQQIYEKITK